MNCDKKNLLLYAVTDRSWLDGQPLSRQVERALQGGVSFLQLREKELNREEFYEEAKVIQALCRKYHVPFIINDDVELAVKIGADGVHVGQNDMAARAAREKLGPDRIIGVSARTVEEALEAQRQGADYLGAGAVFHTGTKKDAVGMDHRVLREICGAVQIPVVAIGGVTRENILQLKGTGISGVAVISAIFAQEDTEAAARELRALAEEAVNG